MLVLEHCKVDLERRLVLRGDDSEPLTTKEAELLAYLVERAGTDVSRDELLRDVWGFAGRLPNTRAPDFAMRRLRAKVEADPSRPVHLLTVHGQGYRYVALRSGVSAPPGPGPALQAPGAAFDPEWCAPRPEAERDAAALLAQVGAPVVIVAPRAMGKTWLLRRLLRTHLGPGDRLVEIDVGALDPDGAEDFDEALLQLAVEIAWATGTPDEAVAAAWERMGHPRRKLTRFVEQAVLPSVEGRLLLAIDGADRWQRQGDPSGFFGLLRSWAARPREPWDRLRLILTVSTEPSALVADPHLSPFNLAPPVRLGDLEPEAVGWLIARHGQPWEPDAVSKLAGLVGGHPLLVRLILHASALQGVPPARILAEATSESGVLADHLRRLVRAVRAVPQLREGVRALLDGASDVPPPTLYVLEAAGVAICVDGRWQLRNRAYAEWLGAHL